HFLLPLNSLLQCLVHLDSHSFLNRCHLLRYFLLDFNSGSLHHSLPHDRGPLVKFCLQSISDTKNVVLLEENSQFCVIEDIHFSFGSGMRVSVHARLERFLSFRCLRGGWLRSFLTRLSDL
ncbi:hypothetical protein PENTCL1PPCAC_24291, partial [Pristionchus entomophagus]